MTSLMTLLKRGIVCGLLASLAAAAFSYFLAEPVMDRAVEMESAREAAENTAQPAAGAIIEHHAEVFSRSTQHAGLIAATLATGLALGALFAVMYWMIHRRDPARAVWGRSLWLAAAAFAAVGLVPFLRYPANPPGTGDPSTVDFRTSLWLAAIALGIAIVMSAWRLHRHLAARGIPLPARQLAVAGLLLAGVALSFALPANPDPLDVPAALLWDFRLLSIGTMLLLWAVMGASFGLLGSIAAGNGKDGFRAP